MTVVRLGEGKSTHFYPIRTKAVSQSVSQSVRSLAYCVVVMLWSACFVVAVPGGDTITRKSGWVRIVR